MNQIQRKIYLSAGLIEAKNEEQEFIGTDKQWEDAERMYDEFINHDCHASPEDGCAICNKYTNE